MSLNSRVLACAHGWSVSDVICGYGPRDRPFEEQHGSVTVAAVVSGTFQYRTTQGSGLLAAGSILLGNHGHIFSCGHDHSTGDRCLSFQLHPDFYDDVVGDVGANAAFRLPCLPPVASLAPLLAAAEVARDEGDGAQLEDLTARIVGAVGRAAAEHAGAAGRQRRASPADIRRVSEVLRWLESHFDLPIALGELARMASLSPFHFLRTFREVAGVTPHQFVLRTRLRRVCVGLRSSEEAVSALAFRAGFVDLATFNRQFRRIVGVTPGAYRRGRAGE